MSGFLKVVFYGSLFICNKTYKMSNLSNCRIAKTVAGYNLVVEISFNLLIIISKLNNHVLLFLDYNVQAVQVHFNEFVAVHDGTHHAKPKNNLILEMIQNPGNYTHTHTHTLLLHFLLLFPTNIQRQFTQPAYSIS